MKICKSCGVEFMPRNGVHDDRRQVYCTSKCGQKLSAKRVKSYFPGLSTGKVGTIAELRVSAELLAKGYSVFRALSPACECDLIALKDGKLLRVEVRTGYKLASGKTYSPSYNNDSKKYDIYAVFVENNIEYYPELPC